ncbi:small-conductance mechanosensitive channel [Desulfobaculum xiamenense]|uniref:Small-conductance mechanosensitive channel n=1 Tax=Desulfobaculum xiamenense TaxID=995050 RepID=A0A846QH74_9BACT|nr:mechanosensitive ion channel domain-containing protein [Desulfobaculum xiamenense]NJB67571.1 small-conductance mechanosensitive channel [Desulfobaculum xiamenense]
MADLLDAATIESFAVSLARWVRTEVLVPATLAQGIVVVGILALAWIASGAIRRTLRARLDGRFRGEGVLDRFVSAAMRTIPVALAFVLVWVCVVVARRVDLPWRFLHLAESLLGAWIAIRLVSSLLLSRFWGRVFAAVAWGAAALNIVGLLSPALKFLDGLGFTMGDARLSVLSLAKAGLVMVLLYRLGMWLATHLEGRLARVPELTPSVRVLLVKLLKIFILVVVVMTALSSVGINLTALAVFSGAVGVGVGFGLQKVAANLISGFILLMDRSIKPGDVVEVGGVYGWITDLRARFVSVVTRDGKEILIPNEDLITSQVVNWSFTDRNVRLKIPVGVAYGCDPRKAIELMLDAARAVPRVLSNPEPVCHLVNFGDSSVDLELRLWIQDPENGLVNVRSAVLLGIWDRFRDNGIEIPFPQRDVHIRTK